MYMIQNIATRDKYKWEQIEYRENNYFEVHFFAIGDRSKT